MKKILIFFAILCAPTAFADDSLNAVCDVLDKALPGNAIFRSSVKGAMFTDTSVVISKKSKTIYEADSKNGNIVFSLSSMGRGESSTCVISIVGGLSGKLIDMDLVNKTFTFESNKEPDIRLSILK